MYNDGGDGHIELVTRDKQKAYSLEKGSLIYSVEEWEIE